MSLPGARPVRSISLGWQQVRVALHVYVLPTTEFVAARQIQLGPIGLCTVLLFLAVHEVPDNGTFTGGPDQRASARIGACSGLRQRLRAPRSRRAGSDIRAGDDAASILADSPDDHAVGQRAEAADGDAVWVGVDDHVGAARCTGRIEVTGGGLCDRCAALARCRMRLRLPGRFSWPVSSRQADTQAGGPVAACRTDR